MRAKPADSTPSVSKPLTAKPPTIQSGEPNAAKPTAAKTHSKKSTAVPQSVAKTPAIPKKSTATAPKSTTSPKKLTSAGPADAQAKQSKYNIPKTNKPSAVIAAARESEPPATSEPKSDAQKAAEFKKLLASRMKKLPSKPQDNIFAATIPDELLNSPDFGTISVLEMGEVIDNLPDPLKENYQSEVEKAASLLQADLDSTPSAPPSVTGTLEPVLIIDENSNGSLAATEPMDVTQPADSTLEPPQEDPLHVTATEVAVGRLNITQPEPQVINLSDEDDDDDGSKNGDSPRSTPEPLLSEALKKAHSVTSQQEAQNQSCRLK